MSTATADLLARIAPMYGEECVDYGAERGSGIGIMNGSGGMMALMDAIPTLRWAWLLETPTPKSLDFAGAAAVVASPVVAWVWFKWGMDDPEMWRQVLSAYPTDSLYVLSDIDLIPQRTVSSLGELVEGVQSHSPC
jgi:hypothetical protein